jgi:hypothetical protein
MSEIPAALVELVDLIASLPGVVAVVLGGSRALGMAVQTSDWDFGVYYRDGIDTSALSRVGTVHPPGSWGRVMNGGAWLTIDGRKVDVLLRDLDVVEDWSARAERGQFEIDALLGYVAGVPTYTLLAERAVARVLHGQLAPVGVFPPELAHSAPARWRFCAQFSFDHARMHAARGDVIATAGEAAKAILEEAHARACASRLWILNEKRLVDRVGLAHVSETYGALPNDADRLVAWVDSLRAATRPG